MATDRDIKDKVQRILANNFEVRLGQGDSYVMKWGSSYVQVSIVGPAWNPSTKKEDAYWVNVAAPLLFQVSGSSELYEYIATSHMASIAGLSMALYEVEGSSGLYNLFLETHILGNFLDEDELVNLTAICGMAADANDDDLARMFGGEVSDPDGNFD